MKNTITFITDILLTGIVYLLGGIDVALKSLIIMMVIDYITGVLSAIYNKKLNSKVGLKGIIKKFCYLIIVAVSVIVDHIVGETGTIRTLVIYFFVANDGISIIENMAKINIPLPKKLVDTLEQLRKESEK